MLQRFILFLYYGAGVYFISLLCCSGLFYFLLLCRGLFYFPIMFKLFILFLYYGAWVYFISLSWCSSLFNFSIMLQRVRALHSVLHCNEEAMLCCSAAAARDAGSGSAGISSRGAGGRGALPPISPKCLIYPGDDGKYRGRVQKIFTLILSASILDCI